MQTEIKCLIYGLEALEELMEEVLGFLNGAIDFFDLRLILSESVSNAFFHGNQGDKSKPIAVRVKKERLEIVFEVQDTGEGIQEFLVTENYNHGDILSDHGRGLFLLKNFTDSMDYQNNTLILRKKKLPHAN